MPKTIGALRNKTLVDAECVKICDAINGLRGLKTFESCCGHGVSNFRVFFTATTVNQLRPLLVSISDMFGWSLHVNWANGGDKVYFCLEGPRGAYHEADDIARDLMEQKPTKAAA